MATPTNPLIPANAVTQMGGFGPDAISSERLQPTSTPWDLGPGIRRNERILGWLAAFLRSPAPPLRG